ncbi:MAG TPA: hypothetical protein VJ878_02665, partial [Candidatus Izemoplasmatales bacterium]|nr:hypothetical protein [Candidatus Izemoplasmatales bacterium]
KAKLKDVSCHHPNYVLHESELNKVLQRLDHQLKKRVSTERQVDVIDQLYYHNIKRYKKRRQHVKRVKKKYH